MKLSKEESKAVEGCACWTSDEVKKLTEDVNECKVKDDMDKIKAQLKKCTKAFGDCRKLEDQAVETMAQCVKPMGVKPIEITSMLVSAIPLTSTVSGRLRVASRLNSRLNSRVLF